MNFENNIRAYPNIKETWTIFGVFIAVSLFIGVFNSLINFLYAFFNWSLNRDLVTLINYILNFSIVLLVIKQLAKTQKALITIQWIKKAPLIVYMLLLLIIPALSLILEFVVSFIPMPDMVRKLFEQTFSLSIPTFIAVALVAPILEEILCRGVVLNGLLKNTTPYKAIVHSSLFFALLHLNPWQGLPAFILGAIMAWVYWKTGSLLVTIFIHFVNNGFSFLLMYIMNDPLADSSIFFGDYYIPVLIFSALLVTLLGFILYKVLEKRAIE